MTELSNFFKDNKDLLTIIVATFSGFLALATFVKVIVEYRLQGRQKRAELFDKFKTTQMTEPSIININSLLEDDNPVLANIPLIDRYHYLGYYEQIAIAMNSGLIKNDVAHYFFGYFPLHCWKSNNFWQGINKDSYYWSKFVKYVEVMQKLEDRNLYKKRRIKIWDGITGRSKFKY